MDGFEPARPPAHTVLSKHHSRWALEVYELLLFEPLKSNYITHYGLEKTGSQMGLRENIRHGQACQARMVRHVRATCSLVEPVHRGADAKCTMPDGRVVFYEAKSGESQLTPYQRQFRLKALESGHHYVIHRCTKHE